MWNPGRTIRLARISGWPFSVGNLIWLGWTSMNTSCPRVLAHPRILTGEKIVREDHAAQLGEDVEAVFCRASSRRRSAPDLTFTCFRPSSSVARSWFHIILNSFFIFYCKSSWDNMDASNWLIPLSFRFFFRDSPSSQLIDIFDEVQTPWWCNKACIIDGFTI